jgi:hypothetical protein
MAIMEAVATTAYSIVAVRTAIQSLVWTCVRIIKKICA